jgi:short subunit dehydrogenase-like uncharacterized protein
MQEMKGMLSGGTTVSLIGLFENYPRPFFKASTQPSALCEENSSKNHARTRVAALGLSGTRYVPDLGILTTSAQAMTDIGLIYRSASLFDAGAFYGQDFTFAPFMRVGGRLSGALTYYAIQSVLAGFLLSPFRALVKKLAFQPGAGPDLHKASDDLLSYKAIGVADDSTGRRSYSTYRYEGSIYYMSGITVTEAALVLCRGGDCLAKRLGGMVTPAALEMEYVTRLRNAGIQLDWGVLDA